MEPIALDQARQLVEDHVQPLSAVEQVPLHEALGRVLAESFCTDGPWPSTDRSAMDGFAMATGGEGIAAGTQFEVVGQSLAGTPFDGSLQDGQAVRIMTGGVVPEGADTVVRVEDTDGFEGGTVTVSAEIQRGADIRPQGSEVAEGTEVLSVGRRIGPAEVGALAVLGAAEVPVRIRPRLRVISTGDEVVDLRETPLPHQVRDSNSWAVHALAQRAGAEPERLGIVPDDQESLRKTFGEGLEADVMVTIGGVSKGTHDLVHTTLQELGVETVFHGIAMKPGKPTYFGIKDHGDRKTFVFGLPGNPQSTFATFLMLVEPALALLQGEVLREELIAAAAGTPWRKNWREQIVPTRLFATDDGRLEAEMARLKPSGDPFGLLDGAAFARVPGDATPEETPTVHIVTGEAPGRRRDG